MRERKRRGKKDCGLQCVQNENEIRLLSNICRNYSGKVCAELVDCRVYDVLESGHFGNE